MKNTRTLFLPVAFVVPTLFSTLPSSAPAVASESTAAQPNALLGELHAVVGGARAGSVLFDGRTVALTPVLAASTGSSQCKGAKSPKAAKMRVPQTQTVASTTCVHSTQSPALMKTVPKPKPTTKSLI